MATLTSDRRLYVTADRSQVVEEGDPHAAYLLVGVGGQIDSDSVARHGLSWKDGKVVVPGAKAMPAPENKMAPPPENKGSEGDADPKPVTLEEMLSEWESRGLKSEPEAYLARRPEGPQAELAQAIVNARADDGERTET